MTKREFLDTVFALAPNEANKIMDAFDEYVESNEPHWIPVEQDLPKENYLDDGYVEPSQPVLVYMSYHTCKISRYWEHRKSKGTSDYVIPDWMDLEEYEGDNVIAWMPLPEPYKPTVPPECEGDCGWCKPTVIEKCKGVMDGRN